MLLTALEFVGLVAFAASGALAAVRARLAVCAGTALVVFAFHPQVARLRRGVLLADALGLGVFATAGTTIAIDAGATVYAACLIGMTTGIGGGAVRDLLLREIPLVLRKEIYAVAALAGSVLVAVGHALRLPAGPVTVVSAAAVVAVRMIALWRHWNAPVARPPE